ncbi:sodium-potassium ATPase [Sistotremastrum suecicum HHB10207 ss-3]|uniref:Sodium-potassium ATPase n=1 Tax=Sistotremastrum suecicum HHB10207 ss-3 TaxID=1314776 RepID=A0A166E1Y9_9AGAM|nr:sodium-potassium ATPase [Sistotremastrum suecicum HHB10207 ss-3]
MKSPYDLESINSKEKSSESSSVTAIDFLPSLNKSTSGPPITREATQGPVDPGARFPIEYRTLSIHLTSLETKHAHSSGKPGAKGPAKDLASLDWHKISVKDALQRLRVSPRTGLDRDQCSRRLAVDGKNMISAPRSRLLLNILEWFFGGFGSLLFVSAIIAFICWKPLGDPPLTSNLALGVVLLLVLVVQAAFNAWQSLSTSRVMASIQNLLPASVTVLRDGTRQEVPSADLVVGDLVIISMGMKIPADMRIIEGGGLKFDRSILTGESEPIAGTIDKTEDNILETKNIVLQGTHCVSGAGTGLVIQTGDTTVFGRIAKLSAESHPGLTTLQKELLRFVIGVAALAFAIAMTIVICWFAWIKHKFPGYINTSALLIDVISILIAFIPEGLPVAVTISLAKVASTLTDHKILCKSLSIVETLGSVTVLCSDKTGTLTKNQMHVEDCAIYDQSYTSPEFIKRLEASSADASGENLRQLAAVAAICNAAEFDQSKSSEKEAGERAVFGDATDTAILRFSDSIKPVHDSQRPWQEIHKINFNSKTKFMLKISRLLDAGRPAPLASWDDVEEECYLLTSKGAPEVLLPRCSRVLNPNGGVPVPLTQEARAIISNIQESWAADGRRVLLLARKILQNSIIPNLKGEEALVEETINANHNDLIIVGLVAIIDPLKDDIKETVSKCRGAGIRFLVVTGDHPLTSAAIARQAGIITNPTKLIHNVTDLIPNLPKEHVVQYQYPDIGDGRGMKSLVITGPELARLSEVQWDQLTQYDEIVFARTTPEQKLDIVRAFQQRENTVAMTGDGVNDAPSLRAACIGIAMGSGSDVAREAADMVLLDSFSSIIVALEYGRLVYDNLKKSVLYLLPAGSFAELMPVILNVFFGLPQMMSNLQMILICVATDVLPALSLCLEKPEQGLLSRKPRNVRKDHLVDWKLVFQAYVFLGIPETLCANAMAFWYLKRKGVEFSNLARGFGNWPGLTDEDLNHAQSVYFFTLIIMQWGNLLATRSRRLSIFQHKPSSNWFIFPAMACAISLGMFFSYLSFFQKNFQTRGVPIEYYFIPLSFSAALLLIDEARKYVVRNYPNSFVAKMAW